MGYRSRLLPGILTLMLGACASPESPGRTTALSNFTGEAVLIWHDSNDDAVWRLKGPPDSIERPETIKLIFTLEQAAYPDCLRIPAGTSASINSFPMIIDERGSNDDHKGHHCVEPHFTGELRRDALDGSDGVIRITDGKTTITMRVPRLLAAREPSLRPTTGPVARGQELTVDWTAGTRWAPDTARQKRPGYVTAFTRAASKPAGAARWEQIVVATDGLTSTLTVPLYLAPGEYELLVSATPLIEAADCEVARSCEASARVNRVFNMMVK